MKAVKLWRWTVTTGAGVVGAFQATWQDQGDLLDSIRWEGGGGRVGEAEGLKERGPGGGGGGLLGS